jgi:hypothetical protein
VTADANGLHCTEASASAIKTSVELIDDAVYADDADWTDDTSKHILTGGVYQSAVHTVTDGDVSPMQVDIGGRTIIVGAKAHDAAVAGSPVTIGGKALALGSATTDVSTAGDAANLISTMGGRLYVCSAHPNRVYGCVADHNTAQANHSVIAASGSASTSIYITDIMISNGATAGSVQILDGSGGAVLWYMYCAINGGCAIQLHTPIKLTANTAVCYTSTTVTTHTVAVGGFISAP